jgi:integrase
MFRYAQHDGVREMLYSGATRREEQVEHVMSNAIIEHGNGDPVELAIVAWLDAKVNRSGSQKTLQAYRTVVRDFQRWLHGQGMDLDAQPEALTLLAQAWISQRQLRPASRNQHLAILSSFYTFARKQNLLRMENPIERIERAKVQAYAGALPLEPAEIRARLKQIDRTELNGMRDYALLALALQTGRRLSELANLRCGDLERRGAQLVVHWRRTKGGKQMHDAVPQPLGNAIGAWLQTFYGIVTPPIDAPLWVSLARNGSYGAPLSTRSIANICEARLGVSTVHSLRHTFAREIQAKLGHESLDTTGRYLAALKRVENPQADAIAAILGLDE